MILRNGNNILEFNGVFLTIPTPVPVPWLSMTFNVPTTKTLAEWNAFFDTVTYATTPFDELIEDGNNVILKGATELTIKPNLFNANTTLVSITDYGSVTHIGRAGFYGATSATSFNFPLLVEVEDFVFSSCSSAISYDFPLVTTIGQSGFDTSTLATEFNFPSLLVVGDSGFRSCAAATEFSFPLLRETLNSAFKGCSSVLSFDLPSLTTI